MKKSSSKNIMTGIGVAMALGSGAALIGSAMMSDSSMMKSMRKGAEKAIKNVGSFIGNM